MMTKTRREGRHQAYLAYGEAVNPAIIKYNAVTESLDKEFKELDASIRPGWDSTRKERQIYLDLIREPKAKYRALKSQAWGELRDIMSPAEIDLCNTTQRLQDEETQRLEAGEDILEP